MVMLVWLILCLFKVCSFSWLPVFIDAVLIVLFSGTMEEASESIGKWLVPIFAFGVAVFAFLKFFCYLSISGWWVLASAVLGAVILVFPGGFTIMNLLFEHFGLMILPTWVLIVGIVLDAIMLAGIIAGICASRKK